MTRIRRYSFAALLVLPAAALGAGLGTAVTSAAAGAPPMLKFETMGPISGPYLGPDNSVRGVTGGGRAWRLDTANGLLQSDGHLVVHVRGLVLQATGSNPISRLRAIVSCQDIVDGSTHVTNLMTASVPATSGGDADFNTSVALPQPCFAPIVFVTSPAGAWFATTGT